jgi:molybdopterin-binding protein
MYAGFAMKLSARNKLDGTVEEIKMGDVVAHVTVRVSGGSIRQRHHRRSAEEMTLEVGDEVRAVIKSTEVMLEKD